MITAEQSIESDVANKDDIRQILDTDFIVTGFFTPDYAPLATAFAKNLTEYRISHHLYARAKLEGSWKVQTLQKPDTLAEARRNYPHAPLILMDVDCSVRGNISDIVPTDSDIALRLKRKATRFGVALMPCARVLVVRPTAGGSAFLEAWDRECKRSIVRNGTDEISLATVLERSEGRYTLAVLPQRYVGAELRDAPADAVIVHDSVHDTTRPAWAARKVMQQYFRKGRNAAYRLATGETYDERHPK